MKFKKLINIDSDRLDPEFAKLMDQDELKYYEFFNKAWNRGMYSGEFITKEQYNSIQRQTRKERMSIHKRGYRVELKQIADHQGKKGVSVGDGDTIAAHHGLSYTVKYLAKETIKREELSSMSHIKSVVEIFITNISRAVSESRRVKRRKKTTDLDNITYVFNKDKLKNEANRYASRLLRNKTYEQAIVELKEELSISIYESTGRHTSYIMLLSYGEIVASLLRKYQRYATKRRK